MNANKKIGILLMLFAAMISVIGLFISDFWIHQFGLWANLLGKDLWKGIEICIGDDFCFPTRYVVLISILMCFYGVSIFLEIINAPKALASFIRN